MTTVGDNHLAAVSEAKTVLQDWMSYLEREQSITFEKDSHRGLTIYSEDGGDQHYAITTEYILLSTDRDLLEETIDRMEDGETAGTLYADPVFRRRVTNSPTRAFRCCTSTQNQFGWTPGASSVSSCPLGFVTN